MTTPAPKLTLVRGRAGERDAATGQIEDAQLLAAVRAGEPRAAIALYERCRPIIARTIHKLLGRGDRDQQDIAQVTMVEIVRSVDRYRGECALDSWIASIAAHVVYKSLRRRRLERRYLSSDVPLDVVARDQPGRTSLHRSAIERVRRHLESMDEGRAWAFLLHDVHGYDLRETAHIMGVSASAAQSRLVRGRRELHARIAGDAELADALEDRGGGVP